jgi:hypothetical protein
MDPSVLFILVPIITCDQAGIKLGLVIFEKTYSEYHRDL